MASKVRIRYGVHCVKHGVENAAWLGKQVICQRPANRTQQRTQGCPECKKELK